VLLVGADAEGIPEAFALAGCASPVALTVSRALDDFSVLPSFSAVLLAKLEYGSESQVLLTLACT